MNNFDYQKRLQAVWEHAVSQYQSGNRDPETYFAGGELAFVQCIGHTPQEIFDFAEDWVNHSEPDFTTFAILADIRRSYFRRVQHCQPSEHTLDPHTLPGKGEAMEGIVWLPRIIEKAKAKLKGELGSDIMYGCGGDRQFLKEHGLHPAEFLRLVECHWDDHKAILDYVRRCSQAVS